MFYRFLLEIPTLTLFTRNDVFSLFHLYRHCEKGFSPTWQSQIFNLIYPSVLWTPPLIQGRSFLTLPLV